jgi:hypothetical protein
MAPACLETVAGSTLLGDLLSPFQVASLAPCQVVAN